MTRLARLLGEHRKTKIQISDIVGHFSDYEEMVRAIDSAVAEGLLKPVKSSGLNGRTPALYQAYHIFRGEADDTAELRQEILAFSPEMDNGYYISHLAQYRIDRAAVRAVKRFFQRRDLRESLSYPYSVNERSFQIFGDEKYLADAGAVTLGRLGLSLDKLNCYQTPEPFFYYQAPTLGSRVLIIENKDTFFTLKRLYQEGHRCAAGRQYGLLVYGEGKKIENSLQFLVEIPGLVTEQVAINYFGDLDYEGIGILLNLQQRYPQWPICPHETLYEQMVQACQTPPRLRKQQAVRDVGSFLTCFNEETAGRMAGILRDGCYIPQEALAYPFFLEFGSRYRG